MLKRQTERKPELKKEREREIQGERDKKIKKQIISKMEGGTVLRGRPFSNYQKMGKFRYSFGHLKNHEKPF